VRVALVIPKIPSTPLPELGIAYLAGYIRQYNSPEVRVLDGNSMSGGNEELIARLLEFDPDVIGVSVGYSAYHAHYVSFLRFLRDKESSNYIVVIGGNHATNYPQSFLQEGLADVVVLGEGEMTFSQLIEDMDLRKDWRRQPGICYFDRTSEQIVKNPPRPYISDLDCVPFPAFDLMPFDFYDRVERILPTMLYRGRVSSWVIQERGCPYSCIFCAVSTIFGKKPRYPSIKYILSLIEHRLEQFDLNHVCFWDDVFTFDKARTIMLCKELAARRLGIIWGCQTRVDLVDEELLAAMAEAGCVLIEYGVESVVPEVLSSLKKGITLEQAKAAIEATSQFGISMQINFMIGNIEDTEESILTNVEFGREVLENYNALPCFWVATPLPGTELYHRAVRFGLTGDSFARNTTPTPEMLAGKTTAYLPQRLPRERFNELLRLAWTQDEHRVKHWFGSNRLLLAALEHHKMSLSDYLIRLFPNGIGNFIESRFFVTGYPEEDLWA